jgi:hypothetical protein
MPYAAADGVNMCVPQEEALKPFVAVLRLADSPAVRQRAVQAVAAALTAHPRGLGSGAELPASCCRHLATPLVYLHAGRRHTRSAEPHRMAQFEPSDTGLVWQPWQNISTSVAAVVC